MQGSCDMGSFPHELPGYRHIANPAVRAIYEREWGVTLDPEPGLRIPNMIDAALDGSFRGIYIQGEDIAQSDPDTQPYHRRSFGDGVRGGARPVPERNSQLCARVPAWLDLPREGRDVHQRRTPHQSGAQGDGATRRHGGLGGDAGDRPRDGAGLELHAPVADHGRDRTHHADVRRRVVREAGARLDPVAVQ